MESTRDRIVATARTLFAERGYRGATTSEIARLAEIAEGTIYRHFKDKKELFLACVEPALAATVDQALSVTPGDSLRGIVRQRLAARVALMQANLDAFNILFTEAPYHPELSDMLFERVLMPRTERGLPAEMGETLRRLPRIPNPLIIGVGLTAAIWALLNVGPRGDALFRTWPISQDPDRLVDDLTDFVLYGIAGHPDGPAPDMR